MKFNDQQHQVHAWINRHPHGYRPDKKILHKLEEERKEIQKALKIYKKNPTEENLQALKIEIGDEIFALICLANSKNISRDECLDLTMEKNKTREERGYQKK